MRKFNFKNTYFIYTITFLLLLPIVFLPFIVEGKSFVWKLDGLDQHLPMLQYYGELLRGILSGKGFSMVDFKLGLGFDTITTLSYYVLGDPIALFSVFMTRKNSIFIYDFLILLRFYLAGLSYIVLMKYWKKDGIATALGALIYVFSGFTLYSCLRHPFFMNPLIYLPLILVGVELVLRRKKPFLFIAMIFISAISNFYFFFVLTIITVVYIVFRYVTHYRKTYDNVLLGFVLTGLRTGGFYLLGIMLAASLFLPVVYAFTNNGRLGVGPEMVTGYLGYNYKYYIAFFQGIYTTGVYAGYWTILSFSFVVIVSFAIILCNKRYWKLHMAYILILLGMFIPAFGYFMNGLSYVTNRWGFIMGLLVAVTFRMTYEKIFKLKLKEMISLLLLLISYGILAYVFPSRQTVKEVFFYLLAVVIIVLILQTKWLKERKILTRGIFYVMVFMTLAANGYMLYSSQYCNYVNQFLSEKTVDKYTYQGTMSLISELEDDSFYRVETYGDKALNEALSVGFNDVSGYYSLMDGSITSYLKELEDLRQISAYRFHNLDNRTILDTLAGVKYFVTSNEMAAPYGYTLQKEVTIGTKVYYLFQNDYALPLGYTYDNYMLKNDYDKLSALQKQNAMMNSVILNEDTDIVSKEQINADTAIKKLDVQVKADAGITLSDNQIDINNKRATLTLQFQAPPNSEIYVRFGKLSINKNKSASYSFYAKSDNSAKKKINVRNIYYNSYFGKENYLINMGHNLVGDQNVVVTFPRRQSLSYESIEVYSVDMSYYEDKAEALMQDTLTNIKQTKNHIQGDITLDSQKVMVFGIPYGKGWSAYVDGVKEELIQGNVMYMALPLKAGSHHIVLKYETPYLKLGCMISFVALIVLFGLILYKVIYQQRKYH